MKKVICLLMLFSFLGHSDAYNNEPESEPQNDTATMNPAMTDFLAPVPAEQGLKEREDKRPVVERPVYREQPRIYHGQVSLIK